MTPSTPQCIMSLAAAAHLQGTMLKFTTPTCTPGRALSTFVLRLVGTALGTAAIPTHPIAAPEPCFASCCEAMPAYQLVQVGFLGAAWAPQCWMVVTLATPSCVKIFEKCLALVTCTVRVARPAAASK